jgi:thiosulfate dehydrogenase [quinone] large subunit
MKFSEKSTTITNAPFITALFDNTKLAWIWLIARVYLGYQWVNAGYHKLTSSDWMQTGDSLKGYWVNAVRIPEPPARPPITYDWYRDFLQSMLDHQSYVWFAKLVAIGEFLVGVALILGIFVGLAAFFAGFMNFNYMLAGTVSTNPVFFLLAILLIIAWKTAGYWGGDRFIFKWFGTPWDRRKMIQQNQSPTVK